MHASTHAVSERKGWENKGDTTLIIPISLSVGRFCNSMNVHIYSHFLISYSCSNHDTIPYASVLKIQYPITAYDLLIHMKYILILFGNTMVMSTMVGILHASQCWQSQTPCMRCELAHASWWYNYTYTSSDQCHLDSYCLHIASPHIWYPTSLSAACSSHRAEGSQNMWHLALHHRNML